MYWTTVIQKRRFVDPGTGFPNKKKLLFGIQKYKEIIKN